MTFLIVLGAIALGCALVILLPRIAGAAVFCFFATGCVQCGAGGDPVNAVILLGEGLMIAWVLFDLGRLRQLDRMCAKAKQSPPEVTP